MNIVKSMYLQLNAKMAIKAHEIKSSERRGERGALSIEAALLIVAFAGIGAAVALKIGGLADSAIDDIPATINDIDANTGGAAVGNAGGLGADVGG